MKNILIHLPVAQFIQSGERTHLFDELPKKAKRRADGVRNAVLFGGMALKWREVPDRQGVCQITGVVGKCNLFYLEPLPLAVAAAPVPAAPLAAIPDHDFIDLKIGEFITRQEAEAYRDPKSDSCMIWYCREAFEVAIFRAETGLYNGAFNYQQVRDIYDQLANSEFECAVIKYTITTVEAVAPIAAAPFDIVELIFAQYLDANEFEDWAKGSDEYLIPCSEGFDSMAFREDEDLSTAAIIYDQVADINHKLELAPAPYALITYTVRTIG